MTECSLALLWLVAQREPLLPNIFSVPDSTVSLGFCQSANQRFYVHVLPMSMWFSPCTLLYSQHPKPCWIGCITLCLAVNKCVYVHGDGLAAHPRLYSPLISSVPVTDSSTSTYRRIKRLTRMIEWMSSLDVLEVGI